MNVNPVDKMPDMTKNSHYTEANTELGEFDYRDQEV